jgi:amylosucrase
MDNLRYMAPATKLAYERFKQYLEPLITEQLNGVEARDLDIFRVRLERYFADFYEPLALIYGRHPAFEKELAKMAALMLSTYANRPDELKRLDLAREITPDWFQRETMVGGIYYVDLFAGTLTGIREHLDYLKELGLTYIHLMPLLKPRPGPSDGGYAVENYKEVNPALGTMDDLEALAKELRANGMSLCIDFVLNHTAKEHEWARKAAAGDPEFIDYYLTFDDRTIPDDYEMTLPEVFPDFAPGNFTYYPDFAGKGKWVWTTFNEFQWDLNYTNPAVFRGMLEYMCFLVNKGIDVLRLDAIPFIWKRMGTNCQNQPEVLEILQAFRSFMRIVSPGMIFKAEAIVAPHQLVQYLGLGRHTGKECEIAYNNSLMVLSWSALASRKVALMTHTLLQMPITPSNATWITYVRCHDDIGWAITDENAQAVGENAFLHRAFLNQFYSGQYPGSFARGAIFQYNPRTGDGRMSGMAASLAGLDAAIEANDPAAIEMAIRRIMLLYSIAFSFGGIPLIYMGDEIGLPNDLKYREDPLKAADNRWMHRPPMDWTKAAERHDPDTTAGQIFLRMQRLIEARKQIRQLHGGGLVEPAWTDNQHVFAYRREHPSGRLLALCNFSEVPQRLNANILWNNGLQNQIHDFSQANTPLLQIRDNQIELAPYQFMWLAEG